jgi:predicted CXXCH cytochrome family protein
MLPAGNDSVKGDFANARFVYGDVASTFFKRGDTFDVRTDGPDGVLRDYAIKYTFGVEPLQQYLIELPGGRLQALSIAWDTRPRRAGGQRWFHLYPTDGIAHGDELHWTGRQQNWNFMCADCHSTNVRKQYDAAADTFTSTWSSVNVGCEACHGPGSEHVTRADEARSSGRALQGDNGLTVHLTERRGVAWTIDPSSSQPARSTPRTTSIEIDGCAVCHSRRAQIADGYTPGAPLQDYYEPATLDTPLYYPDGQQRDEVYTYGSFLQSRMANAGVTCSDCHEPHTGQVRAAGNALCTRCHVAARYDTPAHHHHPAGSTGASCVSCHMPARTYMQVDARHDHSLRVPRPALSVSTGAPNACTGCHTGRTAAWAAGTVRTWYGHDPAGYQDFAETFHDADGHRPEAGAALLRIATAASEPAIVRASAWQRLGEYAEGARAVAAALQDRDPLVRRTALRVLDQVAPNDRVSAVVPLLSDPIRSVRQAAARVLAPAAASLSGADRAAFDRAAADLIASGRFNADRPEHRTNLGVFYADLGQRAEAADQYRAAIRLAPDFVPAYVNLAELLRTGGDEPGAERALRSGVDRMPANPELHYALALSLTRSRRVAEATRELRRAAELAPDVPRYAYGYALGLNGTGQTDAAIRVLIAALGSHPDDRDLLLALASIERDAGRLDAARRHAGRLAARYPDDPEARALVAALGTVGPPGSRP